MRRPGRRAQRAAVRPAGVAYVYLNYGMHYLVNAVTEGEGIAGGGADPRARTARRHRLMASAGGRGGRARRRRLCRGPGNLTKALGISLAQNRLQLTAPPLSIEDWGLPAATASGGRASAFASGTDPALARAGWPGTRASSGAAGTCARLRAGRSYHRELGARDDSWATHSSRKYGICTRCGSSRPARRSCSSASTSCTR
jgi:hypothetical protein